MKLNALDVFRQSKLNGYSRWGNGENAAKLRLKKGVAIPVTSPSFYLQSNSKVFAIGSCFARNVEEALSIQGIDVVSMRLDVPYEVKSSRKNGIINKYNPGSIYHELSWALDDIEFNDDIFLSVDGKYIDPNLKHGESPQPLSKAKIFRENLREYFKKIITCDVVILTLGMIECWYDERTQIVLNQPPHPKQIRADSDRFKFYIMDLNDVLYYMSRSIEILERNNMKNIILTTSPVALGRTFTENDIISANCYSKSVLRVSCEELSRQYESVDYFPSYETIMYNDSKICWQNDRAHASDYAVNKIMTSFISRYFNKSEYSDIQDADNFLIKDDIEILKEQVDRYKNILIREGIDF